MQAPPPVETWVKAFSFIFRRFKASAVSPPPTIEVKLFWAAMNSPTIFVPF